MNCKAVQVLSPNTFNYGDVNIGNPSNEEFLIKVAYSAICRTDFSVIDGSLVYYKNGYAKYPIITGHEWVGICEGQPVVGLCIMGCLKCNFCNKQDYVYCENRIETGVVLKDGAHSEYVIMPKWAVMPVPELKWEYSLVEPLAVAIRSVNRMQIHKGDKVLVCGHGSLGHMVSEVLKSRGINHSIYDIKYNSKNPNYKDFQVVFECSGYHGSLNPILKEKGIKIMAMGFEYDFVEIGSIVANENMINSSLGSSPNDFLEAINLIENISIMPTERFALKDFDKALHVAKNGKKVIFNNME